MIKNLSAIILALALANSLHAEERLFPTDILNKGEVDVLVSVFNGTHSSNVIFHGNPGRSSMEEIGESVQLRYGLGSNLHIGLGISYLSHAITETNFSSPPAHFSDDSAKGDQNPTLWITYGFINDMASRVSVNGQLVVSPDTTGKDGTVYTARLLAGWKSSDTLRVFGTFSRSMSDDSSNADSNKLEIGAYQSISEKVTIVPTISYRQIGSTNSMSSTSQSGLGLAANIQLAQNTYLIPDLAIYRNASIDSKDGFLHRDSTNNGKAFKLGLYHLF